MKKLALFLLLLAPFAFASCSSDSESEPELQQPETVYYTVSFDSDGGGDVDSQTIESGKNATEPETKPTKTGYTFSAWYSGENKFDFSSPITKDISLVAKWTANTYTVTLDNNGETTEILATYGEKLPDMEAPTGAGSDFGGFYTEHYAKGTKFIDADGKGCKTWDIADDTTLYAAWGYKISYENLRECENQNPEIYTGEETVVLSDLEHIVGWAFAGWYDAENGGNKVEKIDAGESGQKKLYAHWQEVHYTVKHLFQNIENDEYTENIDLEETIPEFIGATTEATAKSIEGFEAQPFEQKTLTAENSVAVIEIKYNRKTYTVTFDAKGGSEVAPQTLRYGAKATTPTCSLSPYDLVGWYTSTNGGETLAETAFDFNTPITAPVTLYAKWEIRATASDVVEKINAMTESDTVIVTGEISNSDIKNIATAINGKNFGIALDLSNTTGLTSIGEYAFKNCSSLTGIEIPDGVTSIGSHAFYGCSSLTGIEIPDGVTSIGSHAFENCRSLTGIKIPEGVTSIGSEAFYGCKSLTGIEIPDSVTYIGDWAFNGCSSLTGIEIPDGVTYIRNSAFRGCSSLTGIKIPEGVTSIGSEAFESCSSLTSIKIPDSVTSIGIQAFYGCSSLTSMNYTGTLEQWLNINFKDFYSNPTNYTKKLCIQGQEITEVVIPASVKEINAYAFFNCKSLTSMNYTGTLEQWLNIDFGGSDSNPTYYTGKLCIQGQEITEVVIPASVKEIKAYAFYNCKNITRVEIPEGVTSIGYAAFYGCSSLTSIKIPEGVTSIGDKAFYGCRSLTGIEIPEGVTSIGDYAFVDCSSLTGIEIPEGVTSIGNSAFRDCISLTGIEIPGSVTSIGEFAFSGCSSLTGITFEGTVEQWKAITKGRSWHYKVPSTTKVTCSDGEVALD